MDTPETCRAKAGRARVEAARAAISAQGAWLAVARSYDVLARLGEQDRQNVLVCALLDRPKADEPG